MARQACSSRTADSRERLCPARPALERSREARGEKSVSCAYSAGGLMVITTFDCGFAGLSAPVPALGSTAGCVVVVDVPAVAAEIVEGFNCSAAACAADPPPSVVDVGDTALPEF